MTNTIKLKLGGVGHVTQAQEKQERPTEHAGREQEPTTRPPTPDK